MRKLIAPGALLIMMLAAPLASAQTLRPPAGTASHRPQQVLQAFQVRIRQGVRDGSLTAGEARTLRGRMSSLRTEVVRLRQAHTSPTIAERRHLQQQLRRTSLAIYRARHRR